jgi:hypothetical protein
MRDKFFSHQTGSPTNFMAMSISVLTCAAIRAVVTEQHLELRPDPMQTVKQDPGYAGIHMFINR